MVFDPGLTHGLLIKWNGFWAWMSGLGIGFSRMGFLLGLNYRI